MHGHEGQRAGAAAVDQPPAGRVLLRGPSLRGIHHDAADAAELESAGQRDRDAQARRRAASADARGRSVSAAAPRRSSVRAFLWSGLDTVGGVVAGLISVLGVARLVGPEEFGLGAVALGLILILACVVNSLVHDALVREPGLSAETVDSALGVSLFLTLVVVLIAAAASPLLAPLLDAPRLPLLFLAMLPSLVAGAWTMPMLAERRNAMDFGTISRHLLSGRLIGVVIALVMAALGAGAWSLVGQQLAATLLPAASIFLVVPRRPRPRLGWRRAAPLLGYCKYIVLNQLLLFGVERGFVSFVGWSHGMAAAGHWGLATRLVESLTGLISMSLYHVSLSQLSREQHDRERLGAMVRDTQAFLALALVPVLAGLAAAAGPLILFLLGDAWSESATILMILVPGAVLLLRTMPILAGLAAVGNSAALFWGSLAQAVYSVLGLLLVGPLSVALIALTRSSSPLGQLVVGIAVGRRERIVVPLRATLDGVIDLACLGLGVAAGWLVSDQVALGSLPLRILLHAATGGIVTATLLMVVRPRTVRLLVGLVRARLR
jgi:PST family polysaccharide transporter